MSLLERKVLWNIESLWWHAALACTLLVSSSAGLAGDDFGTTTPASGLDIVRAEFGMLNPTGSGKPGFVPSKVIPFIPKQGYGWVIQLRTDKQNIKWKEEFTLPTKPEIWGGPEVKGVRSINDEGRVSIIEREVALDSRRIIYNAWSVAQGDPKGRYVIRVFVENSLAATFEFEVR